VHYLNLKNTSISIYIYCTVQSVSLLELEFTCWILCTVYIAYTVHYWQGVHIFIKNSAVSYLCWQMSECICIYKRFELIWMFSTSMHVTSLLYSPSSSCLIFSGSRQQWPALGNIQRTSERCRYWGAIHVCWMLWRFGRLLATIVTHNKGERGAGMYRFCDCACLAAPSWMNTFFHLNSHF